jgi:hypothetical protein
MSRRHRARRLGVAFVVTGLIGPITTVGGTSLPAVTIAQAAELSGTSQAGGSDLRHLTFTATHDLHAALVAPAAESEVLHAEDKVVVSTILGAGVEVLVDGVPVPASQLGERSVDTKTGVTTYTYYGVAFHEGPNDVTITALGAGDLRGPSIHSIVYGAGKPASLRAHLDGVLRADGKSRALLTIEALDSWGHAAAAGTSLRARVSRGDAHLVALAANAPAQNGATPVPVPSPTAGPQAATELALGPGGTAQIALVPGTVSGNVVVDLECGDLVASQTFFVAPYARAPLVVGLASAGTGAVPGSQDGDGNVDGGGSRRGRIALFGTGALANGASATFAYDTASRLAPTPSLGVTAGNAQDRPFQTMGDGSSLRDDAISDQRLYARIADGHDALTAGRFTADLGEAASAAQYHEVVSGVKLDLGNASGTVAASAFEAKNPVTYAREVLAVTGLGTLGRLLEPDIVPGTDIVTLVALDRRTGAVVTQTTLQRDVDYSLDDLSGMLRFINVPLPYDANFNPQVVVVQYQYEGGAANGRTTGASTNLHLGRGGTTLGIGYVNDVGGTGNFSMLQEQLGGTLPGGAWSLSHVGTSGVATSGSLTATSANGEAYRGTLTTAVRGTRVQLSYDATSAGFANPYGGLVTPGLLDYRASVERALHGGGTVTLAYDGQANRGLGADDEQRHATLSLRKPVTQRLTLEGGIDVLSEHGSATAALLPQQTVLGTVVFATPAPGTPVVPTVGGSTTTEHLGVDYVLSRNARVQYSHVGGFGGGAGTISSQPTQDALTLDVKLRDTTHAYVRSLWSASPQDSFASATATSGATRTTAIGLEQSVGQATTVTTELDTQRIGDAQTLYETFGVKEKLAFSKRLSGDAFVQSAGGADTTDGGGFGAYGLSLNYGAAGFHAATAIQDRTGAYGGFALHGAVGGTIGPELSLLGDVDSARTGAFADTEANLGIAFRPQNDDRGASLLEFSHRRLTEDPSDADANTISFLEAYRPTGRLELDGSYAYKLDGDGFYAAHTSLVGLRIDQRFGARFDIGAELRRLDTAGIDARSTEFALEGGWRLGNQVRLAAGYNFTGSADPALAAAPTRRGVYATVTSVVSRVFGWGK